MLGLVETSNCWFSHAQSHIKILRQSLYFQLIELLSDTTTGPEAATGIATILTPCDDVMTKEMSANIRIMYRQRFFMENLPKIAQGFESSTQGVIIMDP